MKLVLSLMVLFGAAVSHAQAPARCASAFFGYPFSNEYYDNNGTLVCNYAGAIPANACFGAKIYMANGSCQKSIVTRAGQPIRYTLAVMAPRPRPVVVAPPVIVAPRPVMKYCPSQFFGRPFAGEYFRDGRIVCDYSGNISHRECFGPGIIVNNYCQSFGRGGPGSGILKSLPFND